MEQPNPLNPTPTEQPDLFDRIIIKPLWQIVYLISVTLLCAITIFLSYHFAKKGLINNEPLMYGLNLQMNNGNFDISCSAELLKHVYKQLAIINAREDLHAQLAGVYYKFYFTFASSQVIFSAAGTLLLFFILKDGWFRAGWCLRYAFAIIAFVTTALYSMPRVLQNEENIKNNTAALMKYYKQEIYTMYQLQKLELKNCKDTTALSLLLEENNKVLDENVDIYFKIDPSALPDPNEWLKANQDAIDDLATEKAIEKQQ